MFVHSCLSTYPNGCKGFLFVGNCRWPRSSGYQPLPSPGHTLQGGGGSEADAWICACALLSGPPPSPRTCHWNCRARAGHEKPDGGRRGMWGRWKTRACAGISRARMGSARARLLARVWKAESAAVGGAGARLRGSHGRGAGLRAGPRGRRRQEAGPFRAAGPREGATASPRALSDPTVPVRRTRRARRL